MNQSHSLFSLGFTTQHSQPIHSDSGTRVSTNTALLESSNHTITPEQYEPQPVLDHSVERNHCDTANCSSTVVSEVESSIDTTPVSESLSFLLPTANTCTSAIDFDIGSLTNDHVSPQDVETALKLGPKSNPNHFPKDCKGRRFPVNIFKYKLQNCDNSVRDWLVWSEARKALFCFPCRLFKSRNTVVGVSVLMVGR